jgi:hypothetical protein
VGKWPTLVLGLDGRLNMTDQVIETDNRSRVVLPGHPDERFLLRENDDGSFLLVPAVVISEAQYEYDTSPELQEVLDRAMSAPRVRRRYERRTS